MTSPNRQLRTTEITKKKEGNVLFNDALNTFLIVRKETRCRHIGYSFRLTARVLLYAPSHRRDSTYHGLCYTSRGALAGTRNSSTKKNPTFTSNKLLNILILQRPLHFISTLNPLSLCFDSVGLLIYNFTKTVSQKNHIKFFLQF